MIDVHDWNVCGVLVLSNSLLMRLAFQGQRKVIVFDDVHKMVLEDLFVQNIVYDIICVKDTDPRCSDYIRRLGEVIEVVSPSNFPSRHIFAVRASIGLDGLVLCRGIREGTMQEWLAAASG